VPVRQRRKREGQSARDGRLDVAIERREESRPSPVAYGWDDMKKWCQKRRGENKWGGNEEYGEKQRRKTRADKSQWYCQEQQGGQRRQGEKNHQWDGGEEHVSRRQKREKAVKGGGKKTGSNQIEVNWAPPRDLKDVDAEMGVTAKSAPPKAPSPVYVPAGRGRALALPAWMTKAPGSPKLDNGPPRRGASPRLPPQSPSDRSDRSPIPTAKGSPRRHSSYDALPGGTAPPEGETKRERSRRPGKSVSRSRSVDASSPSKISSPRDEAATASPRPLRSAERRSSDRAIAGAPCSSLAREPEPESKEPEPDPLLEMYNEAEESKRVASEAGHKWNGKTPLQRNPRWQQRSTSAKRAGRGWRQGTEKEDKTERWKESWNKREAGWNQRHTWARDSWREPWKTGSDKERTWEPTVRPEGVPWRTGRPREWQAPRHDEHNTEFTGGASASRLTDREKHHDEHGRSKDTSPQFDDRGERADHETADSASSSSASEEDRDDRSSSDPSSDDEIQEKASRSKSEGRRHSWSGEEKYAGVTAKAVPPGPARPPPPPPPPQSATPPRRQDERQTAAVSPVFVPQSWQGAYMPMSTHGLPAFDPQTMQAIAMHQAYAMHAVAMQPMAVVSRHPIQIDEEDL